MSAYIVDRNHIRYLMSAALHLARRNNYGLGWKAAGKSGRIAGNDYELQDMQVLEMGRKLWHECVRSVYHRYPDCNVGNAPGPIEEDYQLTKRDIVEYPYLGLIQLLKACDCLEYQSCERDDWEDSEAFHILAAIRKAAWQMTPEYDKAEWGAPQRRERAPLGL